MVESASAEPQIIAAFSSDLMSTMRIRGVVEKMGYQLRIIEDESQTGLDKVARINPLKAEPVDGSDALIFDKITRWNPNLIILNLGDDKIAWRKWLSSLKSSPATRRIPVVCFGPHIRADILKEAENLSAEGVVPRSTFFSGMTSIIEKYARKDDPAMMDESCRQKLPQIAEEGLTAFNNHKFFDAHELLEDAWNADDSPGRDFYRALIQLSVAYLQIERANYRGAYKMLLRSRQWFRLIPDACHGVNVGQLRADSESVYQALLGLGPDNIDAFDRALFRPVSYTRIDSTS